MHPISPEASTRSPGGTYRASIVVSPPASHTPTGSLPLQGLSLLRNRRKLRGFSPPAAWCSYFSRLKPLSVIPPVISSRQLAPFLCCCSHCPTLLGNSSAHPALPHNCAFPSTVSTLWCKQRLSPFPPHLLGGQFHIFVYVWTQMAVCPFTCFHSHFAGIVDSHHLLRHRNGSSLPRGTVPLFSSPLLCS